MGSVSWSIRAREALDALDPLIQERILRKVDWLEEYLTRIAHEPLHRELRGSNKLRVGEYRILYSIRGNTITIEKVGHRRDIYRKK